MNVRATNIRLQYTEDQRPEIILTLVNRDGVQDINILKDAVTKGRKISADIKVHRERRSLDSNAYLWVLLAKMADALRTNKDDLYLLMLERYGVFTHLIVKPEAVDRIVEQWRTVRVLGDVLIKGRAGVQLQCYFGSSTYTTKEMSVLIDGVVSEAKEMGIETLPPDEIERMNQDWGQG